VNIGIKIKEIREKQKISMNTLSRLCNVSQANLSRIESGRQQPAFDTLERIVAALGYTLAEFFSSSDVVAVDAELAPLLQTIRACSPEQRRALQFFLECMQRK